MPPIPTLSRAFLRASVQCRSLHLGRTPPVPPPRESIGMTTPEDFLKALGRDSHTKVNAETWENLFSMTGESLKAAGVGIKDRRYILWAMEKYRQGGDPNVFAVPPTPRKKIRGWGPKVQNGKRVR